MQRILLILTDIFKSAMETKKSITNSIMGLIIVVIILQLYEIMGVSGVVMVVVLVIRVTVGN